MSTLLVWKEQIQSIYAKHSKNIIWAMQFVLGLLVFGLINSNLGFMKQYATMVYTVILAAVCTFLPLTIMVICASILVLMHLYALSAPLSAVVFVIFLIMYIFYFRFTPKMSWLILLTPIAFALKVPLVIPVAFGLLGHPAGVMPAVSGTIVFYMLNFIKMNASVYKGSETQGFSENIMIYLHQIMVNKEMWIMVIAMGISLLVVYAVHRSSVAHSWKLASAFGAATAIVIVTAGNISFNTQISYISMVISGGIAIIVGLILEILFFSVDYAQTERLQFEDDEYYYYVKAVPKLGVAAPEVSVKHINERKEQSEENQNETEQEDQFQSKATTVIGTDEVRKILDDEKKSEETSINL